MILYHGTSTRKVCQIAERGLKDPFLTSDRAIAQYYAEEESEEGGGNPVVLQVTVRDTSKLRADFPSFEEPLTYVLGPLGLKEREFHEKLDIENLWPKNGSDWKQSLEVVKSVQHSGIIAPSDIVMKKQSC